jgi:rhodanese-related sulfurtransferase
MALRSVTPLEAKRLAGDGAILVDISEADEYARERIPGARHIALSQLDAADFTAYQGKTVIFHCRSGARTSSVGARLMAKADGVREAYALDGGLDAWRSAGLPTAIDRRQPIELLRQLQIIIGFLVLLGTVLGLTVSPWFFAVPIFLGTGVLFAGVTGSHGMVYLLQRAPWNQAAQSAR